MNGYLQLLQLKYASFDDRGGHHIQVLLKRVLEREDIVLAVCQTKYNSMEGHIKSIVTILCYRHANHLPTLYWKGRIKQHHWVTINNCFNTIDGHSYNTLIACHFLIQNVFCATEVFKATTLYSFHHYSAQLAT